MADYDYLTLACEHLGVAMTQVLSSKTREADITLVVDNGIVGCPKHVIPLELLHEMAEPESEMPPEAEAEIEIAPEAGPEQETVAYDATDGAKRQAQMSGVSLSDVAVWLETVPGRQGERITVHTVRDYMRRGDK